MTLQPCTECGELTERNHCDAHKRIIHSPKKNTTKRGYGARWQRLSKRARALQPFCTDCGATTDLQADHTPEAWERYNQGLPIRLQDVDVVCGACNRARGQARPGGMTQDRYTGVPRRQVSISVSEG